MIRTLVEIVGVVAVVISIVFVGMELRQNTDAVQTANHFSLLELNMGVNEYYYQYPKLAVVWDQIDAGDESKFTEEQRADARQIRMMQFNIWEAAFYSHRSGQLDEELWRAWESSYLDYLKTVATREWWESRKDRFGISFQHYIDGLILPGR